jgi:hypothetical protein
MLLFMHHQLHGIDHTGRQISTNILYKIESNQNQELNNGKYSSQGSVLVTTRCIREQERAKKTVIDMMQFTCCG